MKRVLLDLRATAYSIKNGNANLLEGASGCGGEEVTENHRFHWFLDLGGGCMVDLLLTREYINASLGLACFAWGLRASVLELLME